LGAIPYGWDYTCDKDKDGCKGVFKSFNTDESDDLSADFLARIDTENFLNNEITIRG